MSQTEFSFIKINPSSFNSLWRIKIILFIFKVQLIFCLNLSYGKNYSDPDVFRVPNLFLVNLPGCYDDLVVMSKIHSNGIDIFKGVIYSETTMDLYYYLDKIPKDLKHQSILPLIKYKLINYKSIPELISTLNAINFFNYYELFDDVEKLFYDESNPDSVIISSLKVLLSKRPNNFKLYLNELLKKSRSHKFKRLLVNLLYNSISKDPTNSRVEMVKALENQIDNTQPYNQQILISLFLLGNSKYIDNLVDMTQFSNYKDEINANNADQLITFFTDLLDDPLYQTKALKALSSLLVKAEQFLNSRKELRTYSKETTIYYVQNLYNKLIQQNVLPQSLVLNGLIRSPIFERFRVQQIKMTSKNKDITTQEDRLREKIETKSGLVQLFNQVSKPTLPLYQDIIKYLEEKNSFERNNIQAYKYDPLAQSSHLGRNYKLLVDVFLNAHLSALENETFGYNSDQLTALWPSFENFILTLKEENQSNGMKERPVTKMADRYFNNLTPDFQNGGTCSIFSSVDFFEEACFRKHHKKIDVSRAMVFLKHINQRLSKLDTLNRNFPQLYISPIDDSDHIQVFKNLDMLELSCTSTDQFIWQQLRDLFYFNNQNQIESSDSPSLVKQYGNLFVRALEICKVPFNKTRKELEKKEKAVNLESKKYYEDVCQSISVLNNFSQKKINDNSNELDSKFKDLNYCIKHLKEPLSQNFDIDKFKELIDKGVPVLCIGYIRLPGQTNKLSHATIINGYQAYLNSNNKESYLLRLRDSNSGNITLRYIDDVKCNKMYYYE